MNAQKLPKSVSICAFLQGQVCMCTLHSCDLHIFVITQNKQSKTILIKNVQQAGAEQCQAQGSAS